MGRGAKMEFWATGVNFSIAEYSTACDLTIGAWKCNFPAFFVGNNERPTKTTLHDQPTDGHEGS